MSLSGFGIRMAILQLKINKKKDLCLQDMKACESVAMATSKHCLWPNPLMSSYSVFKMGIFGLLKDIQTSLGPNPLWLKPADSNCTKLSTQRRKSEGNWILDPMLMYLKGTVSLSPAVKWRDWTRFREFNTRNLLYCKIQKSCIKGIDDRVTLDLIEGLESESASRSIMSNSLRPHGL